jgi:hypothetical protein
MKKVGLTLKIVRDIASTLIYSQTAKSFSSNLNGLGNLHKVQKDGALLLFPKMLR